ncbi:uncharacterized protein LOC141649091 [Silene latifolia]|uniref:uncharacterized protein LOC141649091 n=1 Tax=Silene latifolia TaxID=37657 RepID=UPI003D78A37B
MSSETPLIKHWDEKYFVSRCMSELKSGSLGNGEYVNGVYPVCKRLREAKAAEVCAVVDKPEPGKKYLELPDCFDTDDVIRAKAADVSQAHLLMMKRDVEIFLHLYTQRKEAMGKECGSSTVEDSSTDHFDFFDSAFISDDDSLFTKYFNFICEKVEEMKQREGKHEKGEHEKGKDERNGGFAFDPEKYKVVYSREKGKNKVSDVAVEKPNEEVPTDDDIDNIDVENESVDLSSVDDVVNKVVNEGVVGDRIQDNSVISAYCFAFGRYARAYVFGICGIGCDLDCESPNLDAIVGKGLSPTRSFFCTSHSASLFKLIKAADDEKDLYRKEISNVWDTVIENSEGSLDIGADLVFIPVHFGDHFFCVVVNFVGKTVDYLDNRVYDDFEDSIWVLATNSIVEIFGSYLVEKGFERGSEVRNFKFVNVAFGWKSEGSQNLDCGVFVMIHMMFYAGKLFKSELHDALKRIIYRAEIAAILVLANINKIRKKLLDLVDDFTKTKAPLLPVLLEKRRLAELEAARAEADALEALRVMAEEPDDGVGTPGPRKKSMPGTPMSAGMIRSGRGSRPNSDGLGCSINCGKADTNLLVVSKVMRANSRYTRAMPSKKKQVVDYCFLDDYNLADEYVHFCPNSMRNKFV